MTFSKPSSKPPPRSFGKKDFEPAGCLLEACPAGFHGHIFRPVENPKQGLYPRMTQIYADEFSRVICVICGSKPLLIRHEQRMG